MSGEFGGDIISLTDEEGQEIELEHLDTLEYNENTYMAFIPADLSEDEDEVDFIILKVEEEDGEEILVSLEDEKEASEVYEEFMKRLSEDGDEETDADDEEEA